jgi:hypothetical protein
MKNVGRIALIAILTLLIATVASAARIHVIWNPNTEPDLAGYRIYHGTESGQYGEPVDVGNVTGHVMEITPEYGATHYFAVTAYDTSGNESGFSPTMGVLVPEPPEVIVMPSIDLPPGRVVNV